MHVQIRFTGVFLFLRPSNPAPDQGTLVRVLMPNGIDASHHDDDTPAEKHYGYLIRDDSAPRCEMPGKKSSILLSLYHKEIVIRFDGGTAGTPDREGYLDFRPYHPRLVPFGQLTPAVRLRQGLDPHDRTGDRRLGARITIGRGIFSTCAADGNAPYVLRGKLTPGDPSISPAQHLICDVHGVQRMLIDYRDSAAGSWETLAIEENGTVRLTFGHLCEVDPHAWPDRKPKVCAGVDVPDADFKWLYRLLEPASGTGWPGNKTDLFSVPIGVCSRVDRKMGATTSTCFPGECEDCPE